MMTQTVFIYELLEPGTLRTRYVGKAVDPVKRYQSHLFPERADFCHRANWIRALQKSDTVPVLNIIDEVPEHEWVFWEQEYIRLYRLLGLPLVNGTAGGDGLCNPTPETREKIRQSRLGKFRGMPVVVRVPKVSRPRKGYAVSLAHRLAMSQSRKGKRFSLAHRKQLSLAAFRRWKKI